MHFPVHSQPASVEEDPILLQLTERFTKAHIVCLSPALLTTLSPPRSPCYSCTGLSVVHMHRICSCSRVLAWLFSLPGACFLQNVIIQVSAQMSLLKEAPLRTLRCPCPFSSLIPQCLFLTALAMCSVSCLTYPLGCTLCESRIVAASFSGYEPRTLPGPQ